YTAFSSVLLGTLAAFVLTRIPRFRGRTLFGGMVTAPLVMPEVITGLSLLIAVAASYLAMSMTARPRFGLLPCLLAACCIGLGIAAMHYTGMAAMRSVATQYYQPSLFALSVLIAIGAAFTALAAVPYLRGRRSARYRYMKLIASLLLAGAIAAM
ncbi:MHYT domain-containing protein, partial [Klebsiella pneumoniae]|uniref:MHYT domain-containing protein n=1 Tax=Klebsiella pneumoniae TaxID=573 RepID=UPI0029FF203A